MRRVFGLVAAVTAAVAGVGVTATPAQAGPKCFGRAPTIFGSPNDDVLVGTRGSDVIIGGNGDDRIRGRAGNDFLCGFGGDDVIDGGGGRDRIDGGRTDDLVRGGAGPDHLLGGDQNDFVHGNAGNDYIDGGDVETSRAAEATYGGLGNDTLVGGGPAYGNKGDDVLRSFYMEGGPGDDRLSDGVAGYSEAQGPVVADVAAGTASAPGEGTDEIVGVTGVTGSEFDDTLTAGPTPARLSGGGGADVLTGGPASDDIDGGPGDDLVRAGAGDDFLLDSPYGDETSGDDLLDGGEGTDRITYSGLVPVEVDLALDRATGYGTDALPGIEDVEGSYAADVLLGDDGPNYLLAGYGRDELRGRGGDDLLYDDDSDADRLFGDAGNDGLSGGRRDEVDGGEGNDHLGRGQTGTGGPGDDLFGGVWETADGGEGNDTMTFEFMGETRIDLEAGTFESTGTSGTVASIENVIGSAYADTISGNELPNVLDGRRGDDVVDGRGGDDTLDGGNGNDRLEGGPGTDVCTAGEETSNCEA